MFERGFRQADAISLNFFTTILENIFQKLDWKNKGTRINEGYLSLLWFSDEILILSNSPQELECMLDDLAAANINVGLKINLEKTKVSFNTFAIKI